MIVRIIGLIFFAFAITGCKDTGCRVFTGQSLNNSTILLPAQPSGQLIDSGIDVAEGKLFRARVQTNGLYVQPRKYRAIVRLDPRFITPIVYLANYDYATNIYNPDWQFKTGTFRDNINYLISYWNRDYIKVDAGDVVNLRIINSDQFFDTQMKAGTVDYGGNITNDGTDISSIVLTSGELENMFVDTFSKDALCAFLPSYCLNNQILMNDIFVGQSKFSIKDIEECDPGNPSGLCKMSNGSGLTVSVNNDRLKNPDTRFVSVSSDSGVSNVYYMVAKSNGQLKFGYKYDSKDVFNSPYEHLKSLQYLSNILTNYPGGFPQFKSDVIANLDFARFMAGRYLLEIDVGSGTGQAFQDKIANITKKYVIQNGGVTVAEGNIAGNLYEGNAPKSGRVFYKVEHNYKDIAGNLVFATQSYTGGSGFSTFLDQEISQPLKYSMQRLSAILFSQISHNGNFVVLVQSVLTLYILFFGMMFAIGSVKVTVNELFSRVLKVLIVSMLFSSYGWGFFNKYLFSIFLNATDEFMNNITNASSTVGNPFGFIDPLLTKYFSADLWFILWNYVGHMFKGYILPAILIMIGIFYLMKSLIQVVLGYLMAYVSLCIVIALGPVFITCMLFERTRSLFDNWINVMFGYVLQPTFTLIFVLFIDQISSDILAEGLRPVCYQCLFNVGLHVDSLGLSLDFFCVHGYAPSPFNTPIAEVLRVSALFYCIMRLMNNVVSLGVTMADMLAGGSGAGGAVQGGGTTALASDTSKYVRESAKSTVKTVIGEERYKSIANLRKAPGELASSMAKGAMRAVIRRAVHGKDDLPDLPKDKSADKSGLAKSSDTHDMKPMTQKPSTNPAKPGEAKPGEINPGSATPGATDANTDLAAAGTGAATGAADGSAERDGVESAVGAIVAGAEGAEEPSGSATAGAEGGDEKLGTDMSAAGALSDAAAGGDHVDSTHGSGGVGGDSAPEGSATDTSSPAPVPDSTGDDVPGAARPPTHDLGPSAESVEDAKKRINSLGTTERSKIGE